MTNKDPLFKPLRLKHLTLKNRIVSTAHAPAYAEAGMPMERYQLYHEEKAKGGLAMTMFGGSSCVGPDSAPTFGQLDVSSDRIIPYFQAFSQRIRAHDCALICQISHMGRRTTWNRDHWLPVVAPSRVREPAHRAFPKEMDKSDIRRVIGYYAAAAKRCKDGGLDGVEVLTNGHLPGQFMSSDLNFRTDEYGGSFENRMRFARQVLAEVRSAVGDEFIVSVRAEMEAGFEGGMTLEEGLESLRLIEADGHVDLVNLNVGRSDTDLTLAELQVPSMAQKLAPWLGLVQQFKQELDLPVLHACRISDLATARYAIDNDILDLAGMTRAHIADPHIVTKIQTMQENRIRPCVGAGYCIDRIYGEGEALCIHNVASGREEVQSHRVDQSDKPGKKIVVVGGGVAGMEAARVSAERGHQVVLFEATNRLGGQVVLASKASWRRDLIGIADWLASELEHLNVTVKYNIMADEAVIADEHPDIVVIATGGIPDTDIVPGAEHCKSVWDVLAGEPVSGSVLLFDDCGQHQGVSCADHLARREGVSVELVTPDREAAHEMGHTNAPIYMRNFYAFGVKVTPDHRLKDVVLSGNSLVARFSNVFRGPDIVREVDHVIIEHGTLPVDELYQSLRPGSNNNGDLDIEAYLAGAPQSEAESGFALYRVGDAVACRNIHAAIFDARRLAEVF